MSEEIVEKRIVEEDNKYCVYSKDGSRSFGCYDTKEEAINRLQQVEHFSKKMVLKIQDNNHKEKIINKQKSLIVYPDKIETDDKVYLMYKNKIFGEASLSVPVQVDINEFENLEPSHYIDKKERERRWGDKSEFYVHSIKELTLFDNELEIENEDKEVNLVIVQKSVEDRIIASAVLVPNRTDLQKEYYEGSVTRKAAYYFMENYLSDYAHGIDVQHNKVVVPNAVKVIQSYVLDEEKEFNVDVAVTKSNHISRKKEKVIYPKDTWIMYLKVMDDNIWSDIKSGKLTGLSIDGRSMSRSLKQFIKESKGDNNDNK